MRAIRSLEQEDVPSFAFGDSSEASMMIEWGRNWEGLWEGEVVNSSLPNALLRIESCLLALEFKDSPQFMVYN